MKIVIGTVVLTVLLVTAWFWCSYQQLAQQHVAVHESDASQESLAVLPSEKNATTGFSKEIQVQPQRIEQHSIRERDTTSGSFSSVPTDPTSNSMKETTNRVAPQGVRQDVLKQLREANPNMWFVRGSSLDNAKNLGRVCLKSNLSREEIIALMGQPLLGGGLNKIAYGFAPSQLLEFQFDAQGKIIAAKVTGVSIQPN